MMEQKRSMGVNIFGWVFIIVGIFGLLMYLLTFNKSMGSGIGMTAKAIFCFNLLSSILIVICGIYVLKLKEWARKLILILCSVGILLNVLNSPILFDKAVLEQQNQEFLERYKPEYQQEALKNIEHVEKTFPYVMYSVIIMFIGLYLCPIFYFTRSKVKAQFKRYV